MRGTSKMMIVTPQGEAAPAIEHATIAKFPLLIHPGDVVVFNDTRVFPARLYAAPKGNMTRSIELLLVRRAGVDQWDCWARPAKRVKVGEVLSFSEGLRAEVIAKSDEAVSIRFLTGEQFDEASFWSEVERIGAMPLPPYICREKPREDDHASYQTVYARERGAIAAPTAGLHFNDAILEEIRARAELLFVTLHVGIGTFKPVKVERVEEHVMDSEHYTISEETAARLNAALEEKRRIVAVGTTTVRTLESAIRAGNGRFPSGGGDTAIFITPGFQFQAVDALLTNFHLPESTLLMLVSAFAGRETIRVAYDEAVRTKYLFYSFGDCMFLSRRADAATS